MSGGARCVAGTPSSSRISTSAHARCPASSHRAEQCPSSRTVSHHSASSSSSTFTGSSSRSSSAAYLCASRALRRKTVIVRALFEPPPFQPSKLSISLAPGATSVSPAPPASRRYTLTHNDITGQLWLTVGQDFNAAQISGFYTRLLRDEVVAEWTSEGDSSSLHLYCHVSGEEKWLAPPILRNYIFRREMPLVLDCVLYAERELLQLNPRLAQAQVFVHFQSSVPELNCTERWGVLGERSTWQAVPVSILKRVLFGIMGRPLEASHPEATISGAQDRKVAEEEGLPGLRQSPVVAAATIVEGAGLPHELRPQQQQQEKQEQQTLQPDMELEAATCSCGTTRACAHTAASMSPEQGALSNSNSLSRNVSSSTPEQPVARQTALHTESFEGSAAEVLCGAREGPMPLDGSVLLSKSRQLSNLVTTCRK